MAEIAAVSDPERRRNGFRREAIEFLNIAGTIGGVALAYAFLHNLVSSLACPEYYGEYLETPRPFADDPLLVAIYWAVVGGFPGNVIFASVVASIARARGAPRPTGRDFFAITRNLAILASGLALATGLAAAKLSSLDDRIAPAWLRGDDDPTAASRFLFACWELNAAQVAGYAVGIVLCLIATVRRLREGGSIAAASDKVEDAS